MNHIKYMQMIGRRGGKAGTGKAKRRSPEQCRRAARIRWDKEKRKMFRGHNATPLTREESCTE